MIRHLYTLERLTSEFRGMEGAIVRECFTQEKNSFAMALEKSGELHILYYSCDPRRSAVFLRERYMRARKNTLDIFEPLSGLKLRRVRMVPNDRIIIFEFGELTLTALVFGGPRSNAFLTDSEGSVIESLKSRENTPETYHPPAAGSARSIAEFAPDMKIGRALARCDLFLGEHYAREICARMNVDPDLKLEEIETGKIDEIHDYAREFRRGCEHSEYIYHLSDGDEVLLSLAPLEEFPENIAKFESPSEAVRRLWTQRAADSAYDNIESEIRPPVEKEIRRLKKKISGYEKSLEAQDREHKYRLFADLLMARPNPRQKAGSSIKLTDWEGREVEIPLDEKLDLMENAQKYYEKARKSREESESIARRLPELRLELKRYEYAKETIESADSVKELRKVKEELIKKRIIRMDNEKNLPEQRFRTFELGGGYTLYVGKNAANNDELTMKFAKPNDLWFHARGSSGSHAVLRLDKDDVPPKAILERAAAITAYYSGQKNSKYAPVAYTQKKYVRKPKGANPGSVTISREKVIMVEPGLPEND
ncbi:MAG: Rqc2 family fibronectin-binding protein [Bacteroidota bacterium]